jgi:YesN/AraC family two-component response regulator
VGEITLSLVAVLSDINMPGMDGLQLLSRASCAFRDDERRRQAAECGALEFLAKPVDVERVKAHWGNCLAPRIEETRRSIE